VTEKAGDTDDGADVRDQLAEVLVYAPLGLALEARRLFPQLVDRGRGQVNLARATGHRAVRRYRQWAGHQLDEARGEAGSALRGLGLVAGETGEPETHRPLASPPAASGNGSTPTTPALASSLAAEDLDVDTGPPVDVDTLAIPDYDSLSASQVVPRLAGLADDELEAVRRYEAGGRGRKTILNKIAQIQAA
jgi:hypothetical protein